MIALEEAYTPSLEEIQANPPRGGTVLVSREVVADLDTPVSAFLKVCGEGPGFLLESVEGGERVGRYSFIGSKPRRILRIKDGKQWFDDGPAEVCEDPLGAVQQIIEAYGPMTKPTARFEGGALGYLSYEAARYFERLPVASHDPLDLPDAAFLDVDTVLIFDHVARKIRIVSHVWPDEPLEQAYALAIRRIDAIASRLMAPFTYEPISRATKREFSSNMTPEEFSHIVDSGKEHIFAGDILQVVLSQRLSVPFEGPPFAFYRRLRMVSPSPYMYYLDFGDHQVVGASPELLVQVEGATVVMRPIAGTRPRGQTPDDDEVLAADLAADEKERAEHLMLVDLARNDVGRVSQAGMVHVGEFMYVEKFSHVMHLVSDVEGRLRSDRNAFDALRSAFPAGTVSGAPKIRAMQIIADLERDRRGPYAGAIGFVNTGGDMEMAITIRTGVIKDGMLHVQAGAGIVADSIPEREFVETMNKARALIRAAGGE